MISSFIRSRLLVVVGCALALSTPSLAQSFTFSTFAGTVGVTGTADGVRGAGCAQFAATEGGIAVDGEGNVCVADTGNHTIRKITQVGAFALKPASKDPAVMVPLAAGAGYTVQVSGADDGTGETLIELYEAL